jgi:S-(hydroxymethyl)glutathione dehydrogenase/alcohol dehydrogenase
VHGEPHAVHGEPLVTRAALVTGFGAPLVVEELELRRPGAGEALVRIDATVLCITDVLAMNGFTFAPPPFVSGHAAAGVVEAIGSGTRRVAVGQRVVVAGSAECRACYPCLQGSAEACDEVARGIRSPHRVGRRKDGTPVTAEFGIATMTERMVHREVSLVPVESDLPAEHLCLLGCGVTSAVGAVLEVARVRPGQTVAVNGCGQLGLWMIQAARLAGARRIIAVEPIAARRTAAAALGATHLVDPAQGDPVQQVKDLAEGRGADVSLEAAGSAAAMRNAVLMTRECGTVVVTGVESARATVSLPALEFALKGRRILSSRFGGGHMYRDIPRFADLLARGLIDAHPIVSRRFGLDDINAAVSAAQAREVLSGVITPRPGVFFSAENESAD